MLRFTASDGAQLAFSHTHGLAKRSLVLLHGWSGSRRYWDAALPHLQRELSFPMYALDLRWHGDSASVPETDSPGQLARLAQDLEELIQSRGKDFQPVFVGASMGASVLWAWHDRFGSTTSLKQHAFVFVDQAPLQDRASDWALGSKGCYDAETLARLQAALVADIGAFADGNAACCLSQPIPDATAALLKAETLRCDPVRLGRLMAEHTAKDWRPVLPTISAPCLIMYGTQSGCFPVEGCTYAAQAVQRGTAVAMPGCNHWCYLEQPEEFARIVADWMRGLSPEMETRE